jgi:uncharacterized repeat protein (TIGR03803 family)
MCADGLSPYAGLVQGADGSFYGTTAGGGLNSAGTIFKISARGTLTTLYNFCSRNGCTDGSAPWAAVVQTNNGKFCGTTESGGSNSRGTIFEVTSSGVLTTLYSFCSQSGCTDGQYPTRAALIQNTNGKLYGTTPVGGMGGNGTVFSLAVGLGAVVKTLPTSGKVRSLVIVLGTNLTGATSVTFHGTPATFTVESANAIKATVPSGATTGPVQVVTPSGTLTTDVNFQVLP